VTSPLWFDALINRCAAVAAENWRVKQLRWIIILLGGLLLVQVSVGKCRNDNMRAKAVRTGTVAF
jgi:hypothetical protein